MILNDFRYYEYDRIDYQDVAIVESHVDNAEAEQQAQATGKAQREILDLLLLVVVHNEETQAEEHGEDAVHLAREESSQHIGYCLV